MSRRLPSILRGNCSKRLLCAAACLLLLFFFRRHPSPSVLLIYAHQESDHHRQTNLNYFLRHGLSPDLDCIIVCNGPCSLPASLPFGVSVLRRENKGMDFGAWAAGLVSSASATQRSHAFSPATMQQIFVGTNTLFFLIRVCVVRSYPWCVLLNFT